jgi:hypothetical protein
MKASARSVLKLAEQHDYVAFSRTYNCMINLSGRYDYMESSYFVSQELENAGREIHPTCKEMLDAYITPILLEKAGARGIPVPTYFISNGYFEPPVIIDPINPFMIKSRTVLSASNIESIARSMTRNYTYAICCQELPADSKVRRFRSVLGWSVQGQFRDMSALVWEVFRIPLAKVRVVVSRDSEILLSDISPLPFEVLNKKELDYLTDAVRWGK